MGTTYERFLGYAKTYDEGRPQLPNKALEILKIYLNRDIDVIVDIGCGTGLSTEVCCKYANNTIGIEPSEDMLNQAKLREDNKLKFIKGLGNNTGLKDNFADIVICSQAFHWMEPKTTIREIYRILKKGGIFAVIDADYPPAINVDLEKIYMDLHKKANEIDNTKSKWITQKSEHLANIKNSKLFLYSKEICFDNAEEYDKERFKKFILSQSSIQETIKNNYDSIKDNLENLDEKKKKIFKGESLKAIYTYRMRIGIK